MSFPSQSNSQLMGTNKSENVTRIEKCANCSVILTSKTGNIRAISSSDENQENPITLKAAVLYLFKFGQPLPFENIDYQMCLKCAKVVSNLYTTMKMLKDSGRVDYALSRDFNVKKNEAEETPAAQETEVNGDSSSGSSNEESEYESAESEADASSTHPDNPDEQSSAKE